MHRRHKFAVECVTYVRRGSHFSAGDISSNMCRELIETQYDGSICIIRRCDFADTLCVCVCVSSSRLEFCSGEVIAALSLAISVALLFLEHSPVCARVLFRKQSGKYGAGSNVNRSRDLIYYGKVRAKTRKPRPTIRGCKERRSCGAAFFQIARL